MVFWFWDAEKENTREVTKVSHFLLCEKTLGYGSFSQIGTSYLLLIAWILELFWFSHLTRVLDSVFCKERRTVSMLLSALTASVLCSLGFRLGFPGGCWTVQQHLFSCFSLDTTWSSLGLRYENCYQILFQMSLYYGALHLCTLHLITVRFLEGNFVFKFRWNCSRLKQWKQNTCSFVCFSMINLPMCETSSLQCVLWHLNPAQCLLLVCHRVLFPGAFPPTPRAHGLWWAWAQTQLPSRAPGLA